jgi:hypothetical protein
MTQQSPETASAVTDPLQTILRALMFETIVKNKHGEVTDVDNYRSFMILNALCESVEHVVLNIFEDFLPDNECSVWFQTWSFYYPMQADTRIKTIDCYRLRSSHVFISLVDVTNTFSYITYWKIFAKLIDPKLPAFIVSALAFWYANQFICIK